MKIVKFKHIPKGFMAFAVWPFIFTKETKFEFVERESSRRDSSEAVKEWERIIRHEQIHLKQQTELWFVGFLILYAFFFIQGLLKWRNTSKAYRQNPFEVEAYLRHRDVGYMKYRPKFNWYHLKKQIR